MATVTIILKDTGAGKIEVDGHFDEPGRSYEEMTTNPTQAVSAGLAFINAIKDMSASYRGSLTDDDGTVTEYFKDASK